MTTTTPRDTDRTATRHFLKSAAGARTDAATASAVRDVVEAIIADVRQRGDAAVRNRSAELDGWSPASFRLTPDEIERIVASVPADVIDDIRSAQVRIRRFAEHQRASLVDFEVETEPGVRLGQKNIPVASVGAYVPGGRYPLLASAHMTILTAKVAGVARVVACTPPIAGEIPAATVAAMHLAGADEIHILGGVQAIAAMALGTETMTASDVIVGPGNAYVAEAKRQLFGEVGIDLVAGPTETLVIADETADPFVIAVDLLGQAEHGLESPAVLITTSRDIGERVIELCDQLIPGMPTGAVAGAAWRDFGEVVLVPTIDHAYALADEYASEHVQVMTAEPRRALATMRNYGALFLGELTCVPYGDKVIGTNHTLPTGRAARYTGGLWVGKFLKTVTYQEVTDPATSAALGELCARLSRIEHFDGHARSGDVRSHKHGTGTLDWDPRTH